MKSNKDILRQVYENLLMEGNKLKDSEWEEMCDDDDWLKVSLKAMQLALEKQIKELKEINKDPIDWKGLLIDHCTQCGYPRSNREYQILEAKFKALKNKCKKMVQKNH